MAIATGSTTIIVPEGYVLVPRWIRFFPSRILTVIDAVGVSTQEILLDFFVNGGGVPRNTNISIRLNEESQDFPLYFLADVNASLRIQMRCDVTAFGDNPFNVAFALNANYILSDGGPTNEQIGNRRRHATDIDGTVVFENKRLTR